MGIDGALFDVSKIDNICKDRLSKMTKQEISKETLKWANEYDEELAKLINRDYPYFEEIMNIEREIEKPRKDYEKYSDIKESVLFFYDEYYNEMLNERSEKIMIKVQVLKEFTLGKFSELKNIQRNNPNKNEDGRLYEKDIFECAKEMADYLTGNNAYNDEFVKVIEIIPEEVIEETETEPVEIEEIIVDEFELINKLFSNTKNSFPSSIFIFCKDEQ